MIEMSVLSKKVFPNNPAPYVNNIGSLTQHRRSLDSAAAARNRPLCCVPRRSFSELSLKLATMTLLPLPCVKEMEKLDKIVSLVKGMMVSHGNHGSNAEEERLKKLIRAKEKTVKIHVYVQDALGGSNPTVWEVARSVQTANSPTTFGQVRVLDDLVTAGSERDSEKLGRAQGIITFSDLSESALTMNLTFYFNGGEHKGSSICIGGRNPIGNKDRELPIIGGTGVFRLARGYSISNTFSYDPVSNYGVLEYTFYVAYPDQHEDI